MKPTKLNALILTAALAISLFLITNPGSSAAQNGLPSNGLITSDATWTKANSPYNLTRPVAVKEGVTLTIEPGVVVNLGDFYLQINGTLHAVGSDSEKIQINGHTLGFFDPTRRGYLTFSPSSTSYNAESGLGCIMENVILTGDLLINGASPELNKDTLGEIDINFPPVSGGAPIISNSIITGGMGIYSASPVITGCQISGFSGYFGIGRSQERNYDVVVVEGDSSPIFAHNQISEVGRGGILFSSGIQGNFDAVVFANTFNNSDTYGVAVIGGSGTIIISDNEMYGGSEAILGPDWPYARGILIQADELSNSAAYVTAERNLIHDRSVGIELHAQATIQHNTIRDCNTAIKAAAEATIAYNNFEDYNHSVTLNSSRSLDAANNWWGTTDTRAIAASITDINSDFNLGTVKYTPFLTKPDSQALPEPNAPIPTPNPTTQPTATDVPSENPSATPHATGTQTFWGLDLFEATVVALLAAIFAALIILIITHRRKTRQTLSDASAVS